MARVGGVHARRGADADLVAADPTGPARGLCARATRRHAPRRATALRWRHYDPSKQPLGELFVALAYSTRRDKAKGTKTEDRSERRVDGDDYRGQEYCSDDCRELEQAALRRLANAKHQRSDEGRPDHAEHRREPQRGSARNQVALALQNPSTSSMRLRATCWIHAPCGSRTRPAICTRRE